MFESIYQESGPCGQGFWFQDLMQLFIQYQIPSDLLSFAPELLRGPATAVQQLETVRGQAGERTHGSREAEGRINRCWISEAEGWPWGNMKPTISKLFYVIFGHSDKFGRLVGVMLRCFNIPKVGGGVIRGCYPNLAGDAACQLGRLVHKRPYPQD